jgi:hypothetical protein
MTEKWDGVPANPSADGLHFIGDGAALWWAGKRRWSIMHRAREETPEWVSAQAWAEYRGPITPPATVAALVEALEGAIMGMQNPNTLSASVAMNAARAALAAYREAAR